ncbi:hypothetical protein GOV06_04590 [Candidatus Woesearchaeota archaeon]|nr:hypothetical protein [Candidatus Woesearchaeota archaeon]
MVNKKMFMILLSLVLVSAIAFSTEAGGCCCEDNSHSIIPTDAYGCYGWCAGVGGQPVMRWYTDDISGDKAMCDSGEYPAGAVRGDNNCEMFLPNQCSSGICLIGTCQSYPASSPTECKCIECTTDADCDDGVLCTSDECISDVCENEYDPTIPGCSDVFETDCTDPLESNDYFVCEEDNYEDSVIDDEIIGDDYPGMLDFYVRWLMDGFFDEEDRDDYTESDIQSDIASTTISGYESCSGDADCEYDQAKDNSDMDKLISIQMKCLMGTLPLDQPPCTNDIPKDMASVAYSLWDQAWQNCDLDAMRDILMMHMGGWLGTGTANPTTIMDSKAEDLMNEYNQALAEWECGPMGLTRECTPPLFGQEVCDTECKWSGNCNVAGCTQDADCDDNNLCTIDTCDVPTGNCNFANKNCDDLDKCTTDLCDPLTGNCVNNPLDCDDNFFCTTPDECVQATGQCNNPNRDCSDIDTCTTDSCNENTASCEHLLVQPNECSTDDDCSVEETCINCLCEGGGDPPDPIPEFSTIGIILAIVVAGIAGLYIYKKKKE